MQGILTKERMINVVEQDEIRSKIVEQTYINRYGNRSIKLVNTRLDFEAEYIFIGFTPKGVKLGEIISEGPAGQRWIGKRAEIKLKEYCLDIQVDKCSFYKHIEL